MIGSMKVAVLQQVHVALVKVYQERVKKGDFKVPVDVPKEIEIAWKNCQSNPAIRMSVRTFGITKDDIEMTVRTAMSEAGIKAADEVSDDTDKVQEA